MLGSELDNENTILKTLLIVLLEHLLKYHWITSNDQVTVVLFMYLILFIH